jgi:hypothetical protein
MVITETQLNGGGSVRQLLILLGFIWIAAILSGICWGQDTSETEPAPANGVEEAAPREEPESAYERLKPNDSLKSQRNAISGILLAGTFGAGNQETFDTYYEKYALPRWTDLATLNDAHKELRLDLGKTKSQVHDHLVGVVLDFMKQLAAGPYHPFVQINAVLMIGELNAVEKTVSGDPPKPYPEALRSLLNIVENEKLSDAMRAAAMVGIVRHAAGDLSDSDLRKSITAAMLRLATGDIAPGLDAAGHIWIRGQALQVLGRLGAVGEGNEVFQAILKSVSDADLSFSTRCLAADALGHLNYGNAEGINAVDAATTLGQFLVETCGDEVHVAKESDRLAFRRRMKGCLSVVMTALSGDGDTTHKGLVSLAHEDQAGYLGGLQKIAKSMMDALDNKDIEEDEVERVAEEFRGSVQDWLKNSPK